MSLRPYTWRQAIHKSGLPPTTRLVLLGVAFHVNDAGQAACVSTALLAEETGLSERAVISHLKSVEGQWIITRRHGYSGQQWARNEYLPRLPGDPSLDVEGTERPSVPFAEDLGKGTEPPSVPSVPKGTERHDTKALNVVQGDIVFLESSITPPIIPPTPDSPNNELEAWFIEFWRAYPLKKARAAAWRAVRRLKPGPALRRTIDGALRRWLAERDQLANTRGAFVPAIPHASTWINNQRWEDEVDVPRGAVADDRCATCGAAAVGVANGKPHCREHGPMSNTTMGAHA